MSVVAGMAEVAAGRAYLLLLGELGLQRLDADVARLVHQLAELDAHHLGEPDGGVVDLQGGSGRW